MWAAGCERAPAGPARPASTATARPAATSRPVAMAPSTPAEPATQPAFTDEDYRKHVAALKKEYGEKGLVFIIEKPFVIVGNEDARTVQRRAESTVRWAVVRLKKQFFARDPDAIITVWLLGDKTTYEDWATKITGRKPTTPYGFYADWKKSMVMNIATGGGTLVHEIVHPFVASNFPDCPPWLNEGLGSLYEQSDQRDGKIIGRTNWRLAGLQKAIRDKGTLPFADLFALDVEGFYGAGSGTHYAQARYLCYYLQERGLLEKFYHAFHEAARTDPTGADTLRKTLGTDDLEAFRKKWEAWVLTLRFPE